ncbi:MAG: hypothetical protein HW394_1911 [Acidobacteria bacterium]|nr:hypothetical protein [Acidobacteriota bacterium]
MATMTGTAAASEAIREHLRPTLETVERNVRQARRAVVHARHAVEDCVSETGLQVRRHPLGAVASAAGAGVFAGCLIGLALGWRASSARRSR